MKRFFVLVPLICLSACARFSKAPETTLLRVLNEHTLAGQNSFLEGYAASNSDGMINGVIEIPAGSIEKWEVKNKTENPKGYLLRDFKDGKPRSIQYLPYPVNYGMVPRTLLSKEAGGDGDPLDILVLASAIPRGSIVKAKIIGCMKLVDRDEKDDKLIAVIPETAFFDLNSIEELDDRFPGVTKILKTWFLNYKGPGKIEFLGFGNTEEARKIFEQAEKDWEKI